MRRRTHPAPLLLALSALLLLAPACTTFPGGGDLPSFTELWTAIGPDLPDMVFTCSEFSEDPGDAFTSMHTEYGEGADEPPSEALLESALGQCLSAEILTWLRAHERFAPLAAQVDFVRMLVRLAIGLLEAQESLAGPLPS